MDVNELIKWLKQNCKGHERVTTHHFEVTQQGKQYPVSNELTTDDLNVHDDNLFITHNA